TSSLLLFLWRIILSKTVLGVAVINLTFAGDTGIPMIGDDWCVSPTADLGNHCARNPIRRQYHRYPLQGGLPPMRRSSTNDRFYDACSKMPSHIEKRNRVAHIVEHFGGILEKNSNERVLVFAQYRILLEALLAQDIYDALALYRTNRRLRVSEVVTDRFLAATPSFAAGTGCRLDERIQPEQYSFVSASYSPQPAGTSTNSPGPSAGPRSCPCEKAPSHQGRQVPAGKLVDNFVQAFTPSIFRRKEYIPLIAANYRYNNQCPSGYKW
ncbi:hypothetical protein QBC35DRAFT_546508, partial [Podospora australis]